MSEKNYAEHDRQLENSPTLEQCYAIGQTHAAYGWSRHNPWGDWSDEQKQSYAQGHIDYLEKKKG